MGYVFMKKAAFLLLLSYLFPISVEAGPLKRFLGLEYNYTETLKVSLPKEGRPWKQAHACGSPDGYSIIEYVRNNETLKNRKELITVQFIAHSASAFKPQSAEEYAAAMHTQLSNKCNMTWNTLKSSQNDVTYEWMLNGNQKTSPQHEIARIVWTAKGIHRIAYEMKTNEMDLKSRTKWIDIMNQARLAQ